MQGGTHLAFGTAASVALVGLGGVGLGAGVVWDHVHLPFTAGNARQWAYPNLSALTWVALVGAAAIGSLLPDIDQPGSMITRMPSRQGKAIQRATNAYTTSAWGDPARLTADTVAGSVNLASALLGGCALLKQIEGIAQGDLRPQQHPAVIPPLLRKSQRPGRGPDSRIRPPSIWRSYRASCGSRCCRLR